MIHQLSKIVFQTTFGCQEMPSPFLPKWLPLPKHAYHNCMVWLRTHNCALIAADGWVPPSNVGGQFLRSQTPAIINKHVCMHDDMVTQIDHACSMFLMFSWCWCKCYYIGSLLKMFTSGSISCRTTPEVLANKLTVTIISEWDQDRTTLTVSY